jgi:hypothetical protein
MTYANVNACCELSVVSDHVRLAALEQHEGIRQLDPRQLSQTRSIQSKWPNNRLKPTAAAGTA